MAKPNQNLDFTEDQRQAAADLIQQALDQHGWTLAQAAELCGVDYQSISKMRRTIPQGMRFAVAAKVLLVLGVDFYDYCRACGLDSLLLEHSKNPELQE